MGNCWNRQLIFTEMSYKRLYMSKKIVTVINTKKCLDQSVIPSNKLSGQSETMATQSCTPS